MTDSVPTLPAGQSDRIDLHVALALWAWPALSFACANAFGGSPDIAAAKREWLAGAISEMLTSTPRQLRDAADVEEVLLQALNDEFEVVVDDGSAEETAQAIWRGCELLATGNTAELQSRYQVYLEKEKSWKKESTGFVRGKDDEGEETDWDEDDDEFNGFSDEDIEMGEAPQPTAKKEKVVPQVDEDGFTTVVSKKKR
ncbi:Pre-rRNA-processing protein TSR2 [Cyphellophora attinorum]|uniref:Pre-rRNA-processing protein TSR2 n=1 Tax=Cyphellophora attinorum TaxID=1664694 RepID=A0A0N1NYK8_9EURO|nr:Pre-rRNA-processing protein TSR2 [Phialophora attinorum]KPI39994.1 Pre-rRNA-processing protein TSR2 [Phialophora attinorum]